MTSSGLMESIGSAVLLCIVLLLLSSPLIYAGWKNRNRFQELSSINVKPEDSNVGDYVLFSGKIKSKSDSISSPFRSKNCCIAMWDICTLTRRGTLGAGFVWTQEALGIRSDGVAISTDIGEIRIENLSDRKVLSSGEKVKRSLMADSTSKFSSVEIALDDDSFERKIKPNGNTPAEYENFSEEIGFERPKVNSFGTIKKLFSRLRVPSDTTRYRETTFTSGDTVSVVGKRTRDGVSLIKSEKISPLISPRSISKILRKYRRAYLFQLYFIPLFCIGFSALLGYGAYI